MTFRQEAEIFYKLNILLLAMVCLIWAAPANAFAEEGATANPEIATVPCKGLKPYNNLDELLYQFYINLESDCLFEMPVEELEKVWGIKILSDKRVQGEAHYKLRMSADFKNKPYKSEKDAFFVAVQRPFRSKSDENVFYLIITKEYYEKHATLFPDGNFPKMLPAPFAVARSTFPSFGMAPDPPVRPYIGQINMGRYTYYWASSDLTREIALIGIFGVNEILITRRR